VIFLPKKHKMQGGAWRLMVHTMRGREREGIFPRSSAGSWREGAGTLHWVASANSVIQYVTGADKISVQKKIDPNIF
jgi:hypothetical protein